MSAPAVEAKSLSSLTLLASNPPAYPRNPTHVKHEPLVLYIARVPGSKDVFLSPMKPREKVVTAEDIQSSLYFVHVEQPEDAHLIDPSQYQESDYSDARRTLPNQSSAAPVQRKAIPSVPNRNSGGATSRKPIPGTLAPIAGLENRQNMNAGNYSQRPGMLAPGFDLRRSFDASQSRQQSERPYEVPRRASESSQRNGTTLTLIRRDPASGAQWNVARIEDPPILEISSLTSNDPRSRKKMGAPMYIEVLNPGYSKFLHSENTSRPSLDNCNSNVPVQADVRAPQQPQTRLQAPQSSPQASVNENIFRRRLWMEGTQNMAGNFGHRKKNSYDCTTQRPGSRGSYSGQADSMSWDPSAQPQPAPSFLSREDQAYSTIQVSDKQTSFRGYVFNSPWNGRCEFITGAGGGSLKCRHSVPGLQGASPAAMTVSELRFNLPSGSKAFTPRADESSKRSSFFRRGRHSRSNSSLSMSHDDNAEDTRSSLDRLDLSLGQEFAGGGFGGKQAKLGKMIIEDEGLKMMDLLVAANLGLWWRAYDKAGGASREDRGTFQV